MSPLKCFILYIYSTHSYLLKKSWFKWYSGWTNEDHQNFQKWNCLSFITGSQYYQSLQKLAFLVQTGFLSFKAFQIFSIHWRSSFSNATSEMEQKDYYFSSLDYIKPFFEASLCNKTC